MTASTTFDSTKESLLDMLRSIADGKTQLPDFQRGWVWDDDHIRSLLASLSLSYPVGTVMMLETGGEGVRFKPRPVEGVVTNGAIPERLILDGQQRLTSLYLATLYGGPVETQDARKKQIKRWYYIDMAKALNANGDRDEAIQSLPEDRLVRNFRNEVLKDYSTPDREYEAGLFPMNKIFSSAEWRRGFNGFWQHDRVKSEMFDRFEETVIKRFEQYQMPLIRLLRPTPKDAVCQVFEKVNTGGVSLTVFELMTATFAADDYNLRDDWNTRHAQLHTYKVLKGVQTGELLQTIALLATAERRSAKVAEGIQPENAPGIGCKRKDILSLTLPEYQRWKDPATGGFIRAAKLLRSQKLFDARDLPYSTQLAPLAAIMAMLGERCEHDGVRSKLLQWYWCGVFGELYGSAVESRFARDLPEVLAWMDTGPEPTTIRDANFFPSRLLTLRTRNSAAYKGVHALLLRDGALDFRSGDPIESQLYFDENVDIHHIFPKDWCIRQGIESKHYDSIVNKTPLSAKTNRTVGNRAPSAYLTLLQQQAGIGEQRMDEILESHNIYPLAARLDEFHEFFRIREAELLRRIENAMGKPVVGVSPPQETFVEEAEDEPDGT
jgi:hypothetical protein